MGREEIRGITWDLWGDELSHEQAIQRIVTAGFPVKGGVALTMFAIVEGESGEYQRAWHINVARKADGSIDRTERNGKTYFSPKSIDLGFLQFNVPIPSNFTVLELDHDVVKSFVETMFEIHPELADPVDSAELALDLWKRRGFSPWFAYKPGTIEFWKKKRYGALAFARWHLHSYVGRTDRETGEPLNFIWEDHS